MKSLTIVFLLVFSALFGSASLDQKAFFEKHGYLWIKDFFSEDEALMMQSFADEINQDAEEILLSENLTENLIVVAEANNSGEVCRTEDNLSFYPKLFSFVQTRVTKFISSLMEEPYTLFKDKLNFKKPGGGGFSPHQDFPAYEVFGPHEHITAMLSIDAATLKNGCLQVATNWPEAFIGEESLPMDRISEGKVVLPYVIGGPDHGTIEVQYTQKLDWLPLTTSPRDLVIFNSFLPHYSEPNQSSSSRRAFFFTYNKLSEGDLRASYYDLKRSDPENPRFHIATPTRARNK